MTDAELAIVVKLRDMFSKQLDSIVKNTDKSAKQMEGSWKKLTAGITAAKVAVVGWLTGQVAHGIGMVAELGAKVDRANVAFGAMSKRVGVDATEAIRVMREASGGAVSDLDLMAAANRAIMLGAVQTTEELRKLTLYGAKLGNAMGLTASQGIDYFTTGLARQSNAILDNVGLIIDLEGEYKRLGKTAADLTEDERRSVFGAAVWQQAAEAVRTLGDRSAKFALTVDKLSAAFANLKAEMAKLISGPAADLFNWLAEGIRLWTEGKYGINALDVMLIKIRELKKALSTAESDPILQAMRQQLEAAQSEQSDEFLPSEAQKAKWDVAHAESLKKFRDAVAAGNKRSFALAEKRKALEALEDLQSKTPAGDDVQYLAPNEKDASYVNKVWDAMSTGAERYYKTVKDALGLVSTAVYRVFQDIETNIGDVFFDAMMGKMKSFKDYVKAFVEDIARTLSQMMARQAIGAVLGSLFPQPALTGGLQVYRMHAAGGIADEPSIAGEAGPEAVVPLPGNRKIPVELRGGDGRAVTVNFNISAVDGASVQRMLAREGKTITAIIQDALGRDSHLRAAVQGV